MENDFQVDVEGISDEQILHSAVGILRRDIEKLKISVEDYPKAKLRADYSNLNKFRVRLATKKKQAWPSYHHAKRHSISMY